MRALTVRQPHASLIVAGIKPVENRTWPVPNTIALFADGSPYVADGTGWYVAGDLRIAIHAGKTDDPTALTDWNILRDYIGTEPPPRGALLGYVTVTGYHHADDCRWYERAVHDDGRRSARLHGVRHCSPWAEPNTYHWTLAEPVMLDEPAPMRGYQGLWTVPDESLRGADCEHY